MYITLYFWYVFCGSDVVLVEFFGKYEGFDRAFVIVPSTIVCL